MKKKITFILFFITQYLVSQNFNGDYKSYKTSFKSEIDTTQNFIEKTEFNLSITNEYIIIQDPRIPKKLLIYKCNKPLKKLFDVFIKEDCVNEHLGNSSKTNLTLYKIKDKLNLMLSDDKSSQMFFDLKLQIN
jgi:hypothetical protein